MEYINTSLPNDKATFAHVWQNREHRARERHGSFCRGSVSDCVRFACMLFCVNNTFRQIFIPSWLWLLLLMWLLLLFCLVRIIMCMNLSKCTIHLKYSNGWKTAKRAHVNVMIQLLLSLSLSLSLSLWRHAFHYLSLFLFCAFYRKAQSTQLDAAQT